jgi:glycosyltransferase involved in cell wall biosynthesis
MKVSVVIPVFNNQATIGAALESVLAQRFDQPFEVIVVNDGSTDGTRAVLEKFGDRIRLIDQQNAGVAPARNAGIGAATGKYIALLDGDDTWTEDKLAKTVPVLDNNAACVAVFSNAAIVESGRGGVQQKYVEAEWTHSPTLDEMFKPPSWPILPSSVVVRRETMIAIGGFPEEFTAADYGCEDTFAFLLLREHGEIVFVPEDLVRYRMPQWEVKLTKRRGTLNINSDRKSRGLIEDPQRYFRANVIFARLMRDRFGARGRALAGHVLDGAAHELVMMGMMSMHEGDREYARRCYLTSIRYRPLNLKTYARLAWAAMPASVAQPVSAMLSASLLRSLSGPPFLEERPR